MRRTVVALILCLFVAGCASQPTEHGPEPAEEDGLMATAETGILRGLVLDDAIRPIADATVTLQRGAESLGETITDADGSFGFGDLEPGFYSLDVFKNGYARQQAQALVEAGIEAPAIVKIQLQANPEGAAYARIIPWNGFVACAATGANWCALPELYVGINPFNDDSVRLFYDEFVDEGRVPSFVQIELVWTSTQQATPGLQQRLTATNPDLLTLGQWNYTFGSTSGVSPLVFFIDSHIIHESRLGIDMGLSIETFAPTPGATIEQEFEEFIIMFYGYKPPEGWRFHETGEIPPP